MLAYTVSVKPTFDLAIQRPMLLKLSLLVKSEQQKVREQDWLESKRGNNRTMGLREADK